MSRNKNHGNPVVVTPVVVPAPVEPIAQDGFSPIATQDGFSPLTNQDGFSTDQARSGLPNPLAEENQNRFGQSGQSDLSAAADAAVADQGRFENARPLTFAEENRFGQSGPLATDVAPPKEDNLFFQDGPAVSQDTPSVVVSDDKVASGVIAPFAVSAVEATEVDDSQTVRIELKLTGAGGDAVLVRTMLLPAHLKPPGPNGQGEKSLQTLVELGVAEVVSCLIGRYPGAKPV